MLEEQYGIPRRYLNRILSPWAVKRLEEYGGDIRRFKVIKRHPPSAKQSRHRKTEPGDENNQDISSLVGGSTSASSSTSRRTTPTPTATGRPVPGQPGPAGVRRDVQGAHQVLHPLLDGHAGRQLQRERRDAIPFDGVVLAHSNERGWKAFRNNKNNEAFSTASTSSKVPHCLPARLGRDPHLRKLIRHSSLGGATCAPGTLKMMAQFSVLTRLKEPGELQPLLEDAGL